MNANSRVAIEGAMLATFRAVYQRRPFVWDPEAAPSLLTHTDEIADRLSGLALCDWLALGYKARLAMARRILRGVAP